jgi:hypothetical protein
MLVAIAVYSSVVGVYFELLMFAFVFNMILVLQLWHCPYAFRRLHHLHLLATGLLYTTAFIALSFVEVEKPGHHIYREVIGAVLLLLIGAFFCWCGYNMVAVTRKGTLMSWAAAMMGRCMSLGAAGASNCLTAGCCGKSCFKGEAGNKDPLHAENATLQQPVLHRGD